MSKLNTDPGYNAAMLRSALIMLGLYLPRTEDADKFYAAKAALLEIESRGEQDG